MDAVCLETKREVLPVGVVEWTGANVNVHGWYVSRGRIGRRTFWLRYALPILALGVVAPYADAVLGSWIIGPMPGRASPSSGLGLVEMLVLLFTLTPSVSSLVTRLHDRGHSAWWLLWTLLPYAGALVLFVTAGFLRGHDEANEYGPPPMRYSASPIRA